MLGTHELLKAARQVVARGRAGGERDRFHHVSTDEVYGSLGPDDRAFSERTPYAPNSPYAASKAASDHLVRAYHHTYGLPVTTSNCSNNYGPYQFPEKLIPLMLVNAPGRASRCRSTATARTCATGSMWWTTAGRSSVCSRRAPGETYNVGRRNEWKNLDLVRLLCRCWTRHSRPTPSLRAGSRRARGAGARRHRSSPS